MFKCVQYWPANALIFYVAWSKKITQRFTESMHSDKYFNHHGKFYSILYSKEIYGMNQRTRWILLMKKLGITNIMQCTFIKLLDTVNAEVFPIDTFIWDFLQISVNCTEPIGEYRCLSKSTQSMKYRYWSILKVCQRYISILICPILPVHIHIINLLIGLVN